jgi:hypothetical protein
VRGGIADGNEVGDRNVAAPCPGAACFQ